MGWYQPTTTLDKIFRGGIILKAIHGMLDFLAGLMLCFVSPAAIHHFAVFVTQQELLEDPHDWLANLFLHSTQHLGTGARVFLVTYLWINAAVKLIMAIGILKNQLWAYPFSLVLLGAMTSYELYLFAIKSKVWMVFLVIIDACILWLIWREYGKMRTKLAEKDDK